MLSGIKIVHVKEERKKEKMEEMTDINKNGHFLYYHITVGKISSVKYKN